MPNESVFGLENDCTVVVALNPVHERKLELKHEKSIEDECMVMAELIPNESVFGLENNCR